MELSRYHSQSATVDPPSVEPEAFMDHGPGVSGCAMVAPSDTICDANVACMSGRRSIVRLTLKR